MTLVAGIILLVLFGSLVVWRERQAERRFKTNTAAAAFAVVLTVTLLGGMWLVVGSL